MYYHNIQYFSSKKFTDAEKNNVFSTSVLLFMTLRLPYAPLRLFVLQSTRQLRAETAYAWMQLILIDLTEVSPFYE